jgi:hypothetical protein
MSGPGGQVPPGWYADPHRPGAHRYWDGAQWTEHRSGGQQHPTPPQHYSGPPLVIRQSPGPPPKGRPPRDNTWKWMVAGVVGFLVVIGVAASGTSTNSDPPNVVGKNGDDAERILQEHDLAAVFVRDPVFGRDDCQVTKQSEPKDRDFVGPSVALRCEFTIPDVVGMGLSGAQARLTDARMEAVIPDKEYTAYGLGTRCKVADQSKRGMALPDTKVRLDLRCKKKKPVPEAAPEREPDCDPNYTGACVPPYPPDVDCDSVSGSVIVTGEDVHALDSNGDGQACEDVDR